MLTDKDLKESSIVVFHLLRRTTTTFTYYVVAALNFDRTNSLDEHLHFVRRSSNSLHLIIAMRHIKEWNRITHSYYTIHGFKKNAKGKKQENLL